MKETDSLPLGQILHGDCIEILDTLPEKSVDLIFADPPYNLQGGGKPWQPGTPGVDALSEQWDPPASYAPYDAFHRDWLAACRRVLKDTGTLWVIGSRLNIYRIGTILQDVGFWILNDVVWIKTNPMPGFQSDRFTRDHEVLLWACREKGASYTFHHHAIRGIRDDWLMRSDWILPVCSDAERLKLDGKRAHPAQKPEAILYRILLATSNPGDVILDPFFGSGTSGAVAKKLHRQWIGIEREERYVQLAQERINRITPELFKEEIFDLGNWKRLGPRVNFRSLVESGLLSPGQQLYFQKERSQAARIKADGRLVLENGQQGTIHTLARLLMAGSTGNGWQLWFYEDAEQDLQRIDGLRQSYRDMLQIEE